MWETYDSALVAWWLAHLLVGAGPTMGYRPITKSLAAQPHLFDGCHTKLGMRGISTPQWRGGKGRGEDKIRVR
jgi:hypothetical protein